MIENCLLLKSANKILEYVMKNNGTLTWYNIVRHIDKIKVEKIPPPYYVLQQLVEEGYLERDTKDNENSSKYFITEQGQQYLKAII
jgi:DNA-binding PadR family transcriptional regulator